MKSILIIDDEEAVRLALKRVLERANGNQCRAEGGAHRDVSLVRSLCRLSR